MSEERIGGEISTDLVRLGHKRFRLVGTIQGPSLLTPLADKVTIGEHTRVDDVLLSSWVVQNLRGGIGVSNLDVATEADRYRYGTAWALNYKSITNGALPVEVVTGLPANNTPQFAITYRNTFYVMCGTRVAYYDNAGGLWAPTEPGYVDPSAPFTDGCVVRLNSTNYLILCNGNGFSWFDGVTWHMEVGGGSGGGTVPYAKWVEPFDQKLFALDYRNQLWWTADLTTWTRETTGDLPVDPSETWGLDIFFDSGDRPQLHAATKTGLWLWDIDGEVWVRTRLQIPAHKDGGRGHRQWRDEYYLSAGMEVYHYLSNVISSSALNRDDGLPRDYQGSIAALEATPSWLVAAVNGAPTILHPVMYRGDATGYDCSRAPTIAAKAALYLWTGSAWQVLWLAEQNGAEVQFVHYSDANGTYRLWWGANERLYYVEFTYAVFQPRVIPVWPFRARDWFATGRFDGGWPEIPKVAVRTDVRLLSPSPTERAELWYRLDQSDLWHLLATVNTDGLTTITMEDTPGLGDGRLFYDWEWYVVLERGTDPMKAPTLVMLKLEYALRKDARWGYRMQLVLDEQVDDLVPEAQEAYLLMLADEKHLIDMEYRPSDRSPIDRKVMISAVTAITMPGIETAGRYLVSVLIP